MMIDERYIAGFFDGEGSVVTQQNRVRISIANTNKEVLEDILKFLGFGAIYPDKRKIEHKNWKQGWFYKTTNNEDSLKFIESIIPYMIIKKEKTIVAHDLLLNYFVKIQKWEDNKDEARILLKKGVSYRTIEKLTGIGRTSICRMNKLEKFK